MANEATGFSYGDISIREDLWDEIKDLFPYETYVTSNAGEVKVTQKVHGWNTDNIASVTAGAGTLESTDTAYASTNPVQYTNHTQIIEYGIKVSKTNEHAEHAGMDSKFAREKMKKMKEWKHNFEISASVGTLVSGTGTAARTMQGFIRFGTIITGQSGVSLTSDMFNDMLGTAWQVGTEHDTVLVGRVLKTRISSFTTPTTRNIEANTGEVVTRVDVYDSDYGQVDIVLHRFINQAAANTYNVLATYIREFVKIGHLDEVHFESRPEAGYYKAGSIVGESTVQLSNPLAGQLVRGLL